MKAAQNNPPLYGDTMAQGRTWRFADILASSQEVREKWEKVRKYFFLRESTYDMTRRCNIRCEGCYYYQGQKAKAGAIEDPGQWQKLMEEEKQRGITYVVLAGAEPSLVPDLLKTCYRQIPLGCIATNGLVPIDRDVDYRIHISVWGNDETSQKVRGAPDMLATQTDNYAKDPRAVFVYTFTRDNISQVHEVARYLAKKNCILTFNMFSAPQGYKGRLGHDLQSLQQVRRAMEEVSARYPENIVFSPYHRVVHTHSLGLNDLFSCPYPRVNSSAEIGLGRSFRQYRTDLTWSRADSCCVPDTDCADCRHYAAGSAVVTSKLFRHAARPETFMAWLDYVDVYLAVWLRGYEKSPDLSPGYVGPPGHDIF